MRRCYSLLIALCVFSSCLPGGSFYRQTWTNGWFFNRNDGEKIVRTAKRYIGVPYRHGGETPRGFDCSGYVMYVYKENGIQLPRSVKQQYQAGRRVSKGALRPGDLIFFKTSRKRLSHVGIYVGDGRFLHAPRSGKRVSYANMNKPYWKKRFAGAVTFMSGNRIKEGYHAAL